MRPALTACLAAALSLALPLAACETSGESGPAVAARAARPCFNVRMLNGFETVDRDTLRVRDGGDRYDLDLSGPDCDTVEWTQRLAIETSPSSTWVCVGDSSGQGVIAFRTPATRRIVECRIDAVRPVNGGSGT